MINDKDMVKSSKISMNQQNLHIGQTQTYRLCLPTPLI